MRKIVRNILCWALIIVIQFVLFQPVSLAASNSGVFIDFSKSTITKSDVTLTAAISNHQRKFLNAVEISVTNKKTGEKKKFSKVPIGSALKENVDVSFSLSKELKMNVTSETEYTYTVTARIGLIPYSSSGRFSTPGPKPENFITLIKNQPFTSAESVTIRWTASQYVSYYILKVTNAKTNTVVYNQTVSGLTKNIGVLSAGKYDVEMVAHNKYGTSLPTRADFFEVKNPLLPVQNATLTSNYGMRNGKPHCGVDLAGSETICAVAAGTIVSAGYDRDGGGNFVVILHDDGYASGYFHLASSCVKKGQIVDWGQKIGIMGETGNANGVHLHFEVRKTWRGAIYAGSNWRKDTTNPANYIPAIATLNGFVYKTIG